MTVLYVRENLSENFLLKSIFFQTGAVDWGECVAAWHDYLPGIKTSTLFQKSNTGCDIKKNKDSQYQEREDFLGGGGELCPQKRTSSPKKNFRLDKTVKTKAFLYMDIWNYF